MVRPYRGVSADQRRADRRAQLVEACLDAIGADGVAAATVGAVCERAGLTKRYFYESFTDLDALLVEVLDGLFTDLRTRILAALAAAGPDPVERAQVTVEQLVDAMAGDARLARLYVESPGHPALQPRRQQAFGDYADLWVGDVLGLAGDDPARRVGALLFVAGTTQVVISWLDGTVRLTRRELVDELVALGTIRTTTSSPP